MDFEGGEGVYFEVGFDAAVVGGAEVGFELVGGAVLVELGDGAYFVVVEHVEAVDVEAEPVANGAAVAEVGIEAMGVFEFLVNAVGGGGGSEIGEHDGAVGLGEVAVKEGFTEGVVFKTEAGEGDDAGGLLGGDVVGFAGGFVVEAAGGVVVEDFDANALGDFEAGGDGEHVFGKEGGVVGVEAEVADVGGVYELHAVIGAGVAFALLLAEGVSVVVFGTEGDGVVLFEESVAGKVSDFDAGVFVGIAVELAVAVFAGGGVEGVRG